MMMWTGDEENVHLAVVSAPTKKPTRAQTPVRRWTCCWETGKEGGGGRWRGQNLGHWQTEPEVGVILAEWSVWPSRSASLLSPNTYYLNSNLEMFFFFFYRLDSICLSIWTMSSESGKFWPKNITHFRCRTWKDGGPWWKLPLYVATFRTTSGPADSAEKLRQNWQPQHSFHRPVPDVDVLLGILSH